jgi:Archaeal/vacuolar-type H+-ATPase subunit E
MAQELQALLDKIQNEGIEKANQQARDVAAAAEKAAAEKINAAEKKAADIVAKAEAGAAVLRERAEQALQQSARDVVLETGRKLQHIVDRILLANVDGELDSAFLQEFIGLAVKASAQQDAGDVEILANPAQAEKAAEFARRQLAGAFGGKVKVSASSDVKSGILIVADNGRIEYDFTAASLVGAMSRMMSQSLSAMIFGK